MNFKDILENAGEIPETAYIKFLHQYKKRGKTIHLFFEGQEDQSFYISHVENIFPREYELFYYLCDGKSNVEQNYNDINWFVFSKNRILFFIDKDFDDIIETRKISDENIFETKYYSIENYFVTSECYARFLKEICGIKTAAVIKELLDQFDSQLSLFHKSIRLTIAWIIFCRKNRHNINLNDIDLSKLFEINNQLEFKRCLSKPYKSIFEYLFDTTKCSHFDSNEIFKINRRLRSISEPKNYVRGKYEFWFMFSFYKKTMDSLIPFLNEEIKKRNTLNKTKIPKYKVHIELKETNICEIMGPRVRMPIELSDFLNRNLKKAM